MTDFDKVVIQLLDEDILRSLRYKGKDIVILYERDKTGMRKARQYSKQYKIDAFFINKKFKAKDLSDACLLYTSRCV